MKKFLLLLSLLAACAPQDDNTINGYVEGTYVYPSPYSGGVLDEISVSKGDVIAKGDKLFAVDDEIWQANLRQAQSELDKAYANFADLSKGKRQQELNIIIQQKIQAEAALANAQKEYNRAQKLVKTQISSQADFDKKQADYNRAKARVEELEASLETAMLSAREDELKAAQSEIESAKQKLLKVQKQAENNTVRAKIGGRVEDVYFRLGEYVAAGKPVICLLPPENVKVRFFVSEQQLPALKLKQPVMIACDGCKQPLPAKISFISNKSEFTPPVIYSVESRQKLVFMIEAVFVDRSQNLPVGLPVTVRIGAND